MEFTQVPLKALAYELLDIYNAGRTTKDSTISLDIVKDWIITKLNKYLRQQVAKGYPISESLILQLPCLEVIPVDASECCSEELGCKILRTKNPLPQPMDFEDKDGIISIGSLNPLIKKIDRISFNRVAFESQGPTFTRKFMKCYTKDNNNYLYFLYDKDYCPEGAFLEKVTVRIVPEDYYSALKITDCAGNICVNDDSKFPMTKMLWELIKNDILSNELKIVKSTIEDDSNNNQNNNQLINK